MPRKFIRKLGTLEKPISLLARWQPKRSPKKPQEEILLRQQDSRSRIDFGSQMATEEDPGRAEKGKHVDDDE
jgi:hypothetical protein